MRLVLCGVSLEPHGCVFSAEDVNERQQAIPEGYAAALRLAHAVKQVDFFQVLELVRQNEKARQLVPSTPQECSRAFARRIDEQKADFYRTGAPSIYKSAAGRRSRDPRTAARARLTC